MPYVVGMYLNPSAGKANSGGTLGLPGLLGVISEFQATETLPSEEMDVIPDVDLHTHPPHILTHTRTHVHNIVLVSQVWRLTGVTPAFGRWRFEDQKVKA